MKTNPIFKSKSQNKISKAKTQCVHDMNAKRFSYKNMTRTEQDHNKDTYPKLVLNKMKIM